MWTVFILTLMTLLDNPAAKSAPPINPETYSPSRTVIVLSGNTQVYAHDDPIGVVPPGTVLSFSKVHEQWLMVPRYGGWVFADDVVPVENAVAYYTSIIEKTPTPAAYLHRGIAYFQLNNIEKAQADLEQSIQLGTKDGAAYINLGNVLQRRGLMQEALLNYSKGIEHSPDMALPYIERSSVLMEMQQYNDAAADLEKAISLDPKSPEAYNNRGVLLRLQSKYEDAIKDYTKAIELFGKYSSAYANRGFALRQLGRYEEAVADFNKALSHDPMSHEVANDFAWLLATCPEAKFRDSAKAIELADLACKSTNREDGTYLDTLAAAYASAERYDAAVKTGEEALERLKNDNQSVDVHARVELYRAKKPYVEQLSPKP
ncbi:MAG: tetratricopeptide repeat protein [Planctomycetota bacterium]|nr:MAG: tetratricopeptide repeat protein [Planctomycetota bacterium]